MSSREEWQVEVSYRECSRWGRKWRWVLGCASTCSREWGCGKRGDLCGHQLSGTDAECDNDVADAAAGAAAAIAMGAATAVGGPGNGSSSASSSVASWQGFIQ